jgi:NNP family nitrate/nitrite transporter-like MFS transporter
MFLFAMFPESGAVKWAFFGPLAGALVRPLGGWLSDRLGGAKVTFWNFSVMVAAAAGVLMYLPSQSGASGVGWFFAAFILLFVTTGIGNGSVFRLVPTVFMMLHQRGAEGKDRAARDEAISKGEIEASVALGFTAAIAALGLFFIPSMVAISIDALGTPKIAVGVFVVFYLNCMFITWWWYRREGAEVWCD